MQYRRSSHKKVDMSGTEQVPGETTFMTFHSNQLIDGPDIDAIATETEPQDD